MPVVLLIILLIVQFGLWQHARQVAVAAAQEGLSAAQVPAGTSASGQARAEAFLAEAGGIREPVVAAQRSELAARVDVRGTAPSVIPGATIQVRGVAQGEVERFIPEPGR
jgi:hypothetical protein